jgi:hypothetical protein
VQYYLSNSALSEKYRKTSPFLGEYTNARRIKEKMVRPMDKLLFIW